MIEMEGGLRGLMDNPTVTMNGERVGYIHSYGLDMPPPRLLNAGLGEYVQIYDDRPCVLRLEIHLNRIDTPV